MLILSFPQQVDTNEQGWTCPLGLGLTAVDGQCGQGVPACMEGGWYSVGGGQCRWSSVGGQCWQSLWVVSVDGQCWQSVWMVSVDSVCGQCGMVNIDS